MHCVDGFVYRKEAKMGLRIATNVASLATQRQLASTNEKQTKQFQRIASGQRITSAGDDAAGLAISENMRAQIRSTQQAERNANDGISLVQVAEGGMFEASNILVRMRELAIQASSDTIGDTERGFIDQEIQSLKEEVDRIAAVTEFNGTPLLSGGEDLEIQVGIRAGEDSRVTFAVSENNLSTDSLGISGLSAESRDGARNMLDAVDGAFDQLNAGRARLGAMQNKLQSTVNNLRISNENLSQARGRIADTDIAAASSELIQSNILSQAGIAVLAQANAAPTKALQLI